MERIVRADLQAAFLLHRRPYRETSLLLEVFFRIHGRVPLVARGARRPRRGSAAAVEMQPFRPLLISFSLRGEIGTLRSCEVADAALPPPGAAALPSAFYVNELLMRLLHRFDPHPALFDAYGRLLALIGPRASREPSLRVFEKRLLDEIGYGLVLGHEAGSGRPVGAGQRYVYVPEQGPTPLSDMPATGAMPVVQGSTLTALAQERLTDTDTLREAKQLMRFMLEHHLGDKPLKSRTLLRARP